MFDLRPERLLECTGLSEKHEKSVNTDYIYAVVICFKLISNNSNRKLKGRLTIVEYYVHSIAH